MANKAKNRLFYWDMGHKKTQSKTMTKSRRAFAI
jgi:hypothetical protein